MLTFPVSRGIVSIKQVTFICYLYVLPSSIDMDLKECLEYCFLFRVFHCVFADSLIASINRKEQLIYFCKTKGKLKTPIFKQSTSTVYVTLPFLVDQS